MTLDHMSSRSLLSRAVLASLLVVPLAACGSDDPSSSTAGEPAAAVAPGAVLTARVGTPDKPDAFEISLTDVAGAAVTSLPAGEYTVEVVDETGIHNFALRGPGVDQATSVGRSESPTWTVTFRAGEYSYVCDPHTSSMSGSLSVT